MLYIDIKNESMACSNVRRITEKKLFLESKKKKTNYYDNYIDKNT